MCEVTVQYISDTKFFDLVTDEFVESLCRDDLIFLCLVLRDEVEDIYSQLGEKWLAN